MRSFLALSVIVALASLAPSVRADAATDIAEKVVVVIERAATVADMNKTNCDLMGDKLSKIFDDNQTLFQQARDLNDKLTPEQRTALAQRYQARMGAARRKLTPAVLACRSNPKVLAVISRARAF
jgi:hypothetical protein